MQSSNSKLQTTHSKHKPQATHSRIKPQATHNNLKPQVTHSVKTPMYRNQNSEGPTHGPSAISKGQPPLSSGMLKLFDVNKKQHPFPLPLAKENLLQEYEDVFTGSGTGCFLGDPYHVETDHSVLPVQHAPVQLPIHLQQAYKNELKHLTDVGILSEVQMPV